MCRLGQPFPFLAQGNMLVLVPGRGRRPCPYGSEGSGPRRPLWHLVLFPQAQGRLSSSRMHRHNNILSQRWFPLRHRHFFPKGVLLIQSELTSDISTHWNPAWKVSQKDVGLRVCLGLSHCYWISLLLPRWLTLRLLEPPAQCAHRKSRRRATNLRVAIQGSSQYRGSRVLKGGFKSWLWHYLLMLGSLPINMGKYSSSYLISFFTVNDIMCVKMHFSLITEFVPLATDLSPTCFWLFLSHINSSKYIMNKLTINK